MKKLNILWIEDEHADMQLFKTEAAMAGITFEVFISADKGLEALEAGIDRFDGVLLDAEFLAREDQALGTATVGALSAVWSRVDQLKARKSFTPFILTGKKHLEGNDVFKATYGDYYRKWDDQDRKRLLKDLRNAAEDLLDTQVRHRHQRVFEVCSAEYIGEAAAPRLLSILKLEGTSTTAADTDTRIIATRKILEDVFTACNRQGLVPDAFMPSSSALNETGGFLAGRPARGYQITPGVVPSVVSDLINTILRIAQPAAHRLQVDEHLHLVGSSYILHAVTYMLMDVLLWLKTFADEPPTGPLYAAAVQNGATEPLYTGALERDAYGNVHCGDYSIAPGRLTGIAIGDTIAITRATENTNTRNSQFYSMFAQQFHKIAPSSNP